MNKAADIKLTPVQAIKAWLWFVWNLRPKLVWRDKIHRDILWNISKWRQHMKAKGKI